MKPARERLVVVGNGMAGCRAVEEILAIDPERFSVAIIGAEPRVNYNRIMLSPLLAGEKTFPEIVLNDDAWYRDNGITLIAGKRAERIDLAAREIVLDDGQVAAYDRVILATGSDPFVPSVPGVDLEGVVTFRDVDDVNKMLAACASGGDAVVIGGGLLGLEAAYGLARNGMRVTVLHLMPVLMERQLDASASHLLIQELKGRGIDVVLEARTTRFVGEDRIAAVELEDGRRLDADLVVIAAGIRPSVRLAKASGLDVGRGVKVDASMRTSDPAVFAVGECVEFDGQCFGLVAPIWDQCRAVASALAAGGDVKFAPVESGVKLKVSGCAVYSTGLFSGNERTDDIVFRDAARGVYKRLVLEGDRLVGAVLFGEADDGPWYLSLIKSGEPIGDRRENLAFGRSIAEALAGANPRDAVASWPATAEICGCNGICKGAIETAIRDGGLSTVDEVRAITKASASCGSCTPLVESVLAATLGDAFDKSAKHGGLCKCTHHGHAAVREAIVRDVLKSIPAVMQALEWKSPDGCASCRPALNYYLLCAWPGEYQDDKHSRFINERVHANIQKDGTFSVVPRMWGGLTSARELRAIADVVEEFDIPTVKVTGGQRIDLLGVKKQDLPAVWKRLGDAGMVSGHAYAKGLRTVKTCVGSEWCRFGTQDSTGLGVKLEKHLWGSWTPAKVKLAVSGCPRNCAEATCKDFGVICVDSGYEIHIGGAAGLHIQGTQVLAKAATEAETIEIISAATQLYREEGFYLERVYKWMARVGLDSIKARVVADAEGRRALAARFDQSQNVFRHDPWAERAQGGDAREFQQVQVARMAQ